MKNAFLIVCVAVVMCGCQSSATGWDYNNPSNSCFQTDSSGFDRVPYSGQDTGLILIEGGSFEMGVSSEQDTIIGFETTIQPAGDTSR